MFWRFGGYANISSIDTILDKPDVTLEDLLDESDLIQELKQQNSKLIEFLREEAVLHKLLRYVVADVPLATDEPPHPNDEDVTSPGTGLKFFGNKGKSRARSKSTHKSADVDAEEEKQDAQRKKYAYVACEVLSSEVWSITEAILEYKDHLHEFWDYLRRPAPLDALQAGYFTKVNETLLDKKTEDMIAFLKGLDGIIPEMLKHVDCPMIMDLLLKMISLEKHEGGQGIVDWLQSQDLIPILLSYLSPDNSLATQTSAGDFLKAIITISANATAQDQTVIGPNELTRQLVSEKCMSQLIGTMLKGGNPLTVGVGIVIEVIRKNNSDYDLDSQVGPEPRTSDPIYLGTMLRQFASHVEDFMTLVRSPSAAKPGLKAAFGERIQPLGFDRFKTCELMAELLHCSNMGLLNERGSEAEMRARDADRDKLKAEGKLTPAPTNTASEGDDQFASSVDSHGFHHARVPSNDESMEQINRLEIQNASDEDGFEKVGVPDTDDLPDEVTFDDFNEKIEEDTLPPAPLNTKREQQSSDETDGEATSTLAEPMQRLEVTGEQSDGKPRVSSLTRQIDEQLQSSGEGFSEESGEKTNPTNQAAHPEDKPAPLFARSKSPEKGTDPILGRSSPEDDSEQTILSTATLQPEHQENADISEQQPYEVDLDGSPVVGDLLKIKFVEHQVVPTILDFFFRFPWNNFLHNVVYDVVQQVFNGTLERGYNRILAQDLFCMSKCPALVSKEDITQRVLDGQIVSDKSQKERGMRLGYMGHLTLIAEEVCKFADKYPHELLGEQILDRTSRPEWITYVEGTLTETRDKDNAVLGGVRPENAAGMRGMLNQNSFGNNNGNNNSSALADAGIGSVPADSLALQDAAASGAFESNAGDSTMLSGFGDGEEEEEEEGLEGERREKAVADDEQTSEAATIPTTPATTAAPSIPPPLNIPPSRARRQLAIRLAERRRQATADNDPDAADPAALETAEHLPSIEPLYNASDPTNMRESGTSGLRLGHSSGAADRWTSLFSSYRNRDSDTDSETSSSGSSSHHSDEEQDQEIKDNHPEEDTTLLGRRTRSKDRPSTTTAKTRMSIDDEDPDFGAGRDMSLDVNDEHDDDEARVQTFLSPESYLSPHGHALGMDDNTAPSREAVQNPFESDDGSDSDSDSDDGVQMASAGSRRLT